MAHPYQPSEKPVTHLINCAADGETPDWRQAAEMFAGQPGVIAVFTASQLAAEVERAVAAERERCVAVCKDEAAMRRSAGDMHDEDWESRSRCMAGARAALNCAVGCESGEIV